MLRIYVKSPPAPVEIVPDYYPVKYGLLYNWYAATDARLICAEGWVIPTMAELFIMLNYLGGSTVCGGKLKETGLTYWETPNTGATNEAGYNGKGGGLRNSDSGVFQGINTSFTTFSRDVGGLTGGFVLKYNSLNTDAGIGYVLKAGRQLRPLKLSTTLTDGQTGTYTGNDGKVYRTICIGTQEYLADNLCETKFRNGDWIPGFDGGVYTPIDNATWAAATTAMCCVYDDDLTNM